MYNWIALKGPLNNPVVQFKSATYLLYESTPIFFSAGGVNASAGVLLFTLSVYFRVPIPLFGNVYFRGFEQNLLRHEEKRITVL